MARPAKSARVSPWVSVRFRMFRLRRKIITSEIVGTLLLLKGACREMGPLLLADFGV